LEKRGNIAIGILLCFLKVHLPKKGSREKIENEDVELKSYTLPVESILDTCDIILQFAKVLWEKDGEGTELLERAQR